MANPVNRTIIACSVSALALAIVTLCYWKLRKRRLLTTNTSSAVTSNGTCLISGKKNTNQEPQLQSEDSTDNTSSTKSNHNSSNSPSPPSPSPPPPPSSSSQPLPPYSSSSSTSSFPSLSQDQKDNFEIDEQQNKPSFADITRATEQEIISVNDTISGDNLESLKVSDLIIENNDVVYSKIVEQTRKLQETIEQEDSDEEDGEKLKEDEEIDSLRVEVSSVCSSTLSKDIIEDSVCGEEENEEEEDVVVVLDKKQETLTPAAESEPISTPEVVDNSKSSGLFTFFLPF